MPSRSFAFSLIFMLLNSYWTDLSAATFAVELEPVKLQANALGVVTASYLEPCGTEFAGLLYQEHIGGELQVAVVLRRYHARCMGLKGMQEIRLPMVNAAHFAGISSIDTNSEPLLSKALGIQNLHFTQNLNQVQTHAVYTSQCGQALGLFIQPEATGLRFNILESTQTKPEDCNRTTQTLTITGLDPAELDTYTLRQAPSNTDQNLDYALRRVPLQLLELDAIEPGTKRFQVYYLRRCNEAPIGLIQKNQGKKLQLAMLVAHYESRPCQEGIPKKIWTAYEQALTLDASQRIQLTPAALHEELALVRPTSFRWSQVEDQKQHLEVFTFSSCNRDLGIVARPSSSGLALGILQLRSPEPCNSPLKKVSYAYDLELKEADSQDVKPLQLLGL